MIRMSVSTSLSSASPACARTSWNLLSYKGFAVKHSGAETNREDMIKNFGGNPEDRGLADLDAELEELAVNPRCAPERVGAAHLTN
jgi:hypothetical protein